MRVRNRGLYLVYLLLCNLANWERMTMKEFTRRDLDQWAMLWWAWRYHTGSMRPRIPLEPYYQRQHRNQVRPWQR